MKAAAHNKSMLLTNNTIRDYSTWRSSFEYRILNDRLNASLLQNGVGGESGYDGYGNWEAFAGNGASPYFMTAFALPDESAAVLEQNTPQLRVKAITHELQGNPVTGGLVLLEAEVHRVDADIDAVFLGDFRGDVPHPFSQSFVGTGFRDQADFVAHGNPHAGFGVVGDIDDESFGELNCSRRSIHSSAGYNKFKLLTNPIARAYPSAQVLTTPKQSGTPRPKECGFFTPIVFSMVGRAENKTPERGIISPDFARLLAPDRPHVADGQLPNKEQRIMTALTILTTKIRQIDGLYSLNDLHKAAGGEDKHRPAYFLRNEQTQELVAELNCADSHSLITKEGRNGGTYVCRELVIAYAAWISAAFHLKVIRVFLSQSEPKSLPSQQDHSAQLEEVQKAFEKQYQKLRKRYDYPRKLLEQSGFVSADGKHPARLNISILANTKTFISPLMHLLNEMRIDGHDVSAPWDEFIAMREALIAADKKALEKIYTEALQVNFRSASTAGNK